MMFKTSKGDGIAVVVEEESVAKQDNVKEKHAFMLQKLKSEEVHLMEERQKLESLKEKLEAKAKEEIETKKNSIQKLKGEIIELKVTCEELTKSLNPT